MVVAGRVAESPIQTGARTWPLHASSGCCRDSRSWVCRVPHVAIAGLHAPVVVTSKNAISTSTPLAKAKANSMRAAMIASCPSTRRTGFFRPPEVSLMMTESCPVPKDSPTAMRRQNSTVAHKKGAHPRMNTTVSWGVTPRGSNVCTAVKASSATRTTVGGRAAVMAQRGVCCETWRTDGRDDSSCREVARPTDRSIRSGAQQPRAMVEFRGRCSERARTRLGPCLPPVQTPATGRGGSPATRSGALGIDGNRGGARPSRQGEASAHETA